MPKIPVVATVVAAYRTTFANYLRLLGVAWASTLVLSVIVIGLFMPMIVAMEQGLIGGDPMAAIGSVGPILLYEALLLLLLLIAPIGITRLIFGRPVTWRYFYFALGGDYWRLVLAAVILGLMVIGVSIVVSIPVGFLAGSAAISAGPHADPVALQAQMQAQMQVYRPFIIVPLYAAMLFFAVRFGFFLPAIAVEEKRVGIGRNWALTRGNSWRIAGIIILLFLPLAALGAIQFFAIAALGGPNYMDVFGPPPASLKASGAMMRIYLDHGVLYGAVMLLLYPLFYGPFLAASAHAYRAIVGEAPPAQD